MVCHPSGLLWLRLWLLLGLGTGCLGFLTCPLSLGSHHPSQRGGRGRLLGAGFFFLISHVSFVNYTTKDSALLPIFPGWIGFIHKMGLLPHVAKPCLSHQGSGQKLEDLFQ